MSRFSVSAGLACFTLIAYVGLSNLIQPVLYLAYINPLLNKWVGNNANREFIHGAVATVLLAFAVSGFTRMKVFWRT